MDIPLDNAPIAYIQASSDRTVRQNGSETDSTSATEDPFPGKTFMFCQIMGT